VPNTSTQPLVKVCGLTDPAEAVACAELGVWAIGVVFAPESIRRVGVDHARAVCEALPVHVRRVGVFVDPDLAFVAQAVAGAGLTDVQVHGRAMDVRAVRAAAGVPVFQAFSVGGAADLADARASDADLVLLDASIAGRHGGTGERFDWGLLEQAPLGRRFVLAGGLDPDNVAEAVRRVRPWAVDVSSGVESGPGRKDLASVAAFIDAVHAVAKVR
jgi:phosphoribosylanthranilate isomerase